MAGTFTKDGQLISPWFVKAGATFNKGYRWRTGNPLAPVNLSGWRAHCQVRPRADSDIVLLDLTTENGKIELDSQGGIRIRLGATDTQILNDYKKVEFDVRLIHDPTQFVRVFAGGPIYITKAVTRPV